MTEQIETLWDKIQSLEERIELLEKSNGSKGSGATSSQTTSDKWKEYQDWLNEVPEISDEEIEKGAEEKYPYNELRDGEFKGMLISAKKNAWVDAIKWYREQLKQL